VKRAALIGFAVVGLAGCGGGKGGTTQQAASGGGSGKTVQIKETEYKLAPAKVTIAAPGTVTFEAMNAGKIEHALEIEGNGVKQKIGAIAPGSSAKLTVDLSKAGTYQLYCPIDGHRGLGMQATVVVGGSSAGGGTTTGGSTTTSGGGYGY
jgi:uncharacterized cupredoxin-like copper-binding protein